MKFEKTKKISDPDSRNIIYIQGASNMKSIILKILIAIIIIILMFLAMICSSNIYYFKGSDLKDYRGAIILKESPDSVGPIKIRTYNIIDTLGNYEKISVSEDMDVYNEGDTIR